MERGDKMDNTEKTVMLTMRIPLSLRERFVNIVNSKGQKQNFVLSELVKAYVKENEKT